MSSTSLRVQLVDPPAFTPPYDHALAGALARAGADVELVTSRFAYGTVPRGRGYAVTEGFYRIAPGAAGSRPRMLAKLAQHVPDMLRYRRHARSADVVHFQWLTVQPLDVHLLPPRRVAGRRRPLVLTAHDVLPREPKPGSSTPSGGSTTASTRSSSTPSTVPRACATSSRSTPRRST